MFCRHSGLIKEKLIPKKHVLNLWKRFACINSREDTRGDNTVIDISGFISLLSMITIIVFSSKYAYRYFHLDPSTASDFEKVEALATFLKLKNPALLRSFLTDPGAEESARNAKDFYTKKRSILSTNTSFKTNSSSSSRRTETDGVAIDGIDNDHDDYSIPRTGDIQEIEMETTPLTCNPLTKKQELALIAYEKDRESYDMLWALGPSTHHHRPALELYFRAS